MNSRSNIMLRKTKPDAGRNATSIEDQHAEEQRRTDLKKAMRSSIGELRRVCLFGSTGERHQLKSQIKQEADFQQHMRDQVRNEEQERRRQEDQRMEKHRRLMAEQDAERERMRKERLRQIQEENRLAAEAKYSQRLHSKVNEDSYDRREAVDRTSQFNPNVF
mmetsp:Transcript_1796/g.3896  ORF Transcript_1796/g.3896 Transcript_1796/m.3896 type:complete len:163 (+) Transcript_1796:400-888(+)